MRLEAKHGLFKNKKWKNFKSIAQSVAFFHQQWMCLQQTGTMAEKSPVYLYKGDQVKEGKTIDKCDLSEAVTNCILQYADAVPTKVMSTSFINLSSIEYRQCSGT